MKKLHETLELTTVNEVLALVLALGHTKFVAGPLAIVPAATGNLLLELYTYLVLAQGKMSRLIGWGEVFFLQNNQSYAEPLFKMRASLQHLLYSSLGFASVLFVSPRPGDTTPQRECWIFHATAASGSFTGQCGGFGACHCTGSHPDLWNARTLEVSHEPISIAAQVATVTVQGIPPMDHVL